MRKTILVKMMPSAQSNDEDLIMPQEAAFSVQDGKLRVSKESISSRKKPQLPMPNPYQTQPMRIPLMAKSNKDYFSKMRSTSRQPLLSSFNQLS